MKRSIASFFVCTVLAVVVAELAAFLCVVANAGFGRGDLFPFLIWITPFGIAVAAIVAAGERFQNRKARVVYGVVAGASVGIGWTNVMAILMGPWFGTFSFPVVRLLAASGAVSAVLGSMWWRRR